MVPSQQPILILGGEQSILAAQANDMLSDPVELYTTEYNITGKHGDVLKSLAEYYVYSMISSDCRYFLFIQLLFN